MSPTHAFPTITKWLNDNQGVVSLAIFASTILLGVVSGIFSSLRRVPKFKLSIIEGPTFACTFEAGGMHREYHIHRTGIALYLNIANVGSSASSIHAISVAYHWRLLPFSRQWLRYRIGWFWLHDQAVALDDFQVAIGDRIKIFPFLTQLSSISFAKTETYLEIGKSSCGVVYFEQPDSWGGCLPLIEDEKVRIKVSVEDVFGRTYKLKCKIPFKSLDEARRFNPSFGMTHAQLSQRPLPFDIEAT